MDDKKIAKKKQVVQIIMIIRQYYNKYQFCKLKTKMSQEQQSKSQQYQLQRQFEKEEFVTVVGQLLSSMKITPSLDINEIYDKIKMQNGKVIGKDIIDTVQKSQWLTEQQRYISEQIEYYREMINKLMIKGISCISVVEFNEYFEKNYMDGILTNQLKKKIKNYDYISLIRLTKVIDTIQQQKNKLLVKQSINISNLQKSNIYGESYFQNISQFNVNMIIQYINQIVLDAGMRNNVKGMLLQMENKFNSLEQNNIQLQEIDNTLRKSLEEIDDQLYKTYKIVDEKQVEVDRLKVRIKQLEEEVRDLNKQYQEEVVNYIKNMEAENNKLTKQLAHTSVLNEENQTKLDWFKSNYESLTKQYEQFMSETRSKNEKEKKEKEEKMFIQRTIKQQLEDALAKITILRNQNIELKQKNSDILFAYENKIQALEEKIYEKQNNKQHQIIKLQGNNNNYFRNSRLQQTLSRISRFSKISMIENNKQNNKQISKICQSSQISSHTNQSLLNYYKSNNLEGKFKKKQPQIIQIKQSIMMSQLLDDEIEQQNKYLREQQLQNVGQYDEKQNRNAIISIGFEILADGTRNQYYIKMYENRFCFCDKNGLLYYHIGLKQLNKIIFCCNNTSLMVLKVKSDQMNNKKKKIFDTVLSVTNREDILEFLHLRSWRILLEEGVKIRFEEEDRVWVKSQNSQVLLSNFPHCYNLSRMSINSACNIFEANVVENDGSWFSIDSVAHLVVSNIGILVFERDGEYMFEKNQKLLKIIPLVEFMSVENPSANQLLIRYKTSKKLMYKLTLKSIFLTKKLKNLIEVFYQKILERKKKQIERYFVFIGAVDKNSKNQ